MVRLVMLTGFAFYFLAVSSFVQVVVCQDEIECVGQPLNLTDAQKQVGLSCLKDAGISSVWKIPLEKLPCFGTCILERRKLLDDKGALDHDKIHNYIDTIMPEKVKKPIKIGAEKCLKEHGHAVKVPGDKTCSAFSDIGACIHDVFLENCIE